MIPILYPFPGGLGGLQEGSKERIPISYGFFLKFQRFGSTCEPHHYLLLSEEGAPRTPEVRVSRMDPSSVRVM